MTPSYEEARAIVQAMLNCTVFESKLVVRSDVLRALLADGTGRAPPPPQTADDVPGMNP